MLTFFHFYVSPQDCESPPVIAHGRHKTVSKGLWNQHEEVEYECDEGYILDGAERLSCTSSGWSPAVPQCKGNSGSLFILGGRGRAIIKGLRAQLLPCERHQKNIWFDLLKTITMVWWYPKQKAQKAHRTLISPSFSQVQNSVCEASPFPSFLYNSGNSLQMVHSIWV